MLNYYNTTAVLLLLCCTINTTVVLVQHFVVLTYLTVVQPLHTPLVLAATDLSQSISLLTVQSISLLTVLVLYCMYLERPQRCTTPARTAPTCARCHAIRCPLLRVILFCLRGVVFEAVLRLKPCLIFFKDSSFVPPPVEETKRKKKK